MNFYKSFDEVFSANCGASHLSVFNDCPENLRIYTPHSSAIAYFGPDETDPNAIAVCYKGKYTNPDTGEAIKGAVWVYSFRSPVMRNTQMKRIKEAAANGYSIGRIVDEWKDMADYVNVDPAGNRTGNAPAKGHEGKTGQPGNAGNDPGGDQLGRKLEG